MENRRAKRLQLFRAVSHVLDRQADGEERFGEETVAYLERLRLALSQWLDGESDEADRRFLAVLEEFQAYLEATDAARVGASPAAAPASRLH